MKVFKIILLTSLCMSAFTPLATKQAITTSISTLETLSSDWAMSAANPQRTSWVSGQSNELRGDLEVEWYRVFDPYIDNKVQVIASDGKVFISTSKGLYVFNAADGSQAWVYGTEMPLGNSPTYFKGTLYVGGYDHKIHAISSSNGRAKTGWTFLEAGAGYETNPLVISDTYTGTQALVLAGNRDGYFYALDGNKGSLKWKYQTGGPIRFSAAYKNGVVYFASDDSYAYALNVTNGSLVWKSAKLPGAGFDNYWPVIYTDPASGKDYVLYSGSKKADWAWFSESGQSLYFDENYEMYASQSGCSGSTTLNCSVISNYMAAHPWKRHLFILDRNTGKEYTPYAPVNWAGVTHNGNKHPPIVAGDGELYSFIGYDAGGNNGANGWISQWKIRSSNVHRIYDSRSGAADEPVTFTSGGNLIYWGEGVNANAWGTLDLTNPAGSNYYSWQELRSMPGAGVKYTALDLTGKFEGNNGVYGYFDGLNNLSPIPYNNKL
ncbi:MAG: outer membrane protein assembly factor BamB family protein, partial [Anaerolineales bacterium]